MKPRRPGALRWLWYAWGGGLPPRYRDWVLYDATCRTWRLRHFARAAAQIAPTAIPILLLLPVPLPVRLLALLLGWLVGLRISLLNAHQSVEHRVIKAGHPAGAAETIRDEAKADERAAAAARYNAYYRSDPGQAKP